MRPFALSPRLHAAVDMIGHCRCLADIGCDHGKAVVHCLLMGIADTAIAVDVAKASLDKAVRLAIQRGVSLDCRLGDGLTPLCVDEADCVLIAGMGGIEIGEILCKAPYWPTRLVLVPHRNADKVRTLLGRLGYTMQQDTLVYDGGHWYPVMCAIRQDIGRHAVTCWQDIKQGIGIDADAYVGKDYIDSPLYAAYRASRLDKLQGIIDKGSRDPAVLHEWQQLGRIVPKL